MCVCTGFLADMKIESLGASLGMRWASLASLGIVLGTFGAFWRILENFLSFGLSSVGSQAAHDWALITSGSQVAHGSAGPL